MRNHNTRLLLNWIRTLLSFEILRSVHTCVRGSKTLFHKIPQGDFMDDCRLNAISFTFNSKYNLFNLLFTAQRESKPNEVVDGSTTALGSLRHATFLSQGRQPEVFAPYSRLNAFIIAHAHDVILRYRHCVVSNAAF